MNEMMYGALMDRRKGKEKKQELKKKIRSFNNKKPPKNGKVKLM
jgi:hypothetical protein